LVKYGLRIRDRLREIVTIAQPETLLAWNRRLKKEKWTLFFIHLGTRRVRMAGCTPEPKAAWMAQQARNFCMALEDHGLACRYLTHDRDTSFLAFDPICQSQGIKILKTPVDFDYPQESASVEQVQCESMLGGLLNHYSVRKAA